MKVTRTSMFSGITRTRDLDITEEQLDDYIGTGVLLQDAFPHLSAGDREFIKTGITDEEWEREFGEDN
jgi:hypothetical protein